MTHLATVHTAPSLAAECKAPETSDPRLARASLTLHVNHNYRPLTAAMRAFGLRKAPKTPATPAAPPMTPGRLLARTIHQEFVRLGSEFSTSEGALVTLDFVPSEADMEEARMHLKSVGYVAGKAKLVSPRVSDEKPSVSIWVEYDNADKPYFSKR